ncbi:hypothetical protein EUGRSUZ_E02549 [Eucalyptus grandis]|uniref:Uncharacterized protein n=2 Tax=Eucalyptus grandis TaxID=71139 RepID=A0ACC3KWW6_EUCGR|nr:hypothetical protein EUGRSUZ_E02549 [Eucalyptus grandis]
MISVIQPSLHGQIERCSCRAHPQLQRLIVILTMFLFFSFFVFPTLKDSISSESRNFLLERVLSKNSLRDQILVMNRVPVIVIAKREVLVFVQKI